MKKKEGWAIRHPVNGILLGTVAKSAEYAWTNVTKRSSHQSEMIEAYKKDGYRAVRVEIREVKRK